MNALGIDVKKSFLSEIGWKLFPQSNIDVPSSYAPLKLHLSCKDSDFLIGNAKNELVQNLGPIFRAKVPKEALQRRLDNGAYLSSVRNAYGHIIGQPGFEEIHPDYIISETMDRLYYDLSNQLREQYANVMINQFKANLENIRTNILYNLAYIQMQISDYNVLQYQNSLEAIEKSVKQIFSELSYVIKNKAIRMAKLQVVLNNNEKTEEVASFFISMLKHYLGLGTYQLGVLTNEILLFYSLCKRLIICKIRLSELELALSDAYLDDEFVRERTHYLQNGYLLDFKDVYSQLKKNLELKYQMNLSQILYNIYYGIYPIGEQKVYENDNIQKVLNDEILPPDISIIGQNVSNSLKLLDNVKIIIQDDMKRE